MANQMQPGGNPVRMTPPRPPAAAAPGAMTPKEIFGIIRRHVFMIIFFAVLGIIAGGGGWYLLKVFHPRYTAVGSIEVLPPGTTDPTTFASVQTNKDLFFEFRSTLAFRMRQQGFLEKLLQDDDVRETKWYAGFNDVADHVEDLGDNLRASAQRDKSLIVVSMTCGDPEEAALIADEAIDLFLAIEKEEAERDANGKLGQRKAQRAKIKKKLDDVEDSLLAQRIAAHYSKLDRVTFRDYIDQKLNDVERERNQLESVIENIKETVNVLRIRKEREDFDDVVRERVETDQTAVAMRLSIDRKEVELNRLKSQFGEGHKRVKEIKQALRREKEALVSWQEKIGRIARSAELINAMERQSILETELENRIKQVELARDAYRNLNMLRANYEKDVVRRDDFQAQLEEIDGFIEGLNAILADPTLSKVKWDIRPQPPLEMSFPNIVIFVPGGWMLGLMLGVGLAFAVEMLNDLLRSPSDVMKHLRIPLLGTICHNSEDRSVRNLNLYQVVRDAPYSILSECYRQFRTNLKLSGSGQRHKVMLVTSGESGDGKTSVAVNLTYTLAAENRKILLIDTNFRRPSTAGLFGRAALEDDIAETSAVGLSSYLMAESDLSSIIRKTDVEGLCVVDSGPLPLNPSELLGCDRMKMLLKMAREQFDYIVIDGPPLLVSEAKALASEADGTILVFNTESTRRGAAQRALRELKEVNASIAGCVLVGVKSIKGGYFQEVYRSYEKYQKAQPAMA